MTITITALEEKNSCWYVNYILCFISHSSQSSYVKHLSLMNESTSVCGHITANFCFTAEKKF